VTCVVGLIQGADVYMGSDSLGTGECSANLLKNPKVFRKGGFMIGFTTSYRFGQIVQYAFAPPSLDDHIQLDTLEYMVRLFVPSLHEALREAGWERHEKDEGNITGGNLLVGVRGRLFEIQNDFGVLEDSAPYAAIGCGRSVALGSLHTTQKVPGLAPFERIRAALEAAAAVDEHVEGPFPAQVLRGE
jgi:ATP-dependent protease HslVU (ClpYQ) peptidase subunit